MYAGANAVFKKEPGGDGGESGRGSGVFIFFSLLFFFAIVVFSTERKSDVDLDKRPFSISWSVYTTPLIRGLLSETRVIRARSRVHCHIKSIVAIVGVHGFPHGLLWVFVRLWVS